MLSEGIHHELHFLFYSFILGIIITFVYDNIRVWRRVISHNTFLLSVEDLFFWIWVSLSIFLLQHRENDGVFRWFSVVGAFMGMFLYRRLCSRFYIKKMTLLLRAVLKILYTVFSCLFSPIYFLESRIKILLKKLKKRTRVAITAEKLRLTSHRKMIKMTLCKHTGRRAHEQKDHST